jgi:hypothetical protein
MVSGFMEALYHKAIKCVNIYDVMFKCRLPSAILNISTSKAIAEEGTNKNQRVIFFLTIERMFYIGEP